jgi:hypothetical protein
MTDTPPVPTPASRPATADIPDTSVEFLEAGQLTDDRRTPVPRAQLGRRAQAALWVLRITVLLLVLMVGYTFITPLWR